MPLSPSSSTVALVGATFSIVRQTFVIESLIAITPSSGIMPWRWISERFCSSSEWIWNARCTSSRSTSVSTGFW